METLRAYLNALSQTEQSNFAARCGTTIGYLRKALSTKPKLDGALVRRLWEESGKAVSREDLRPDIFGPALKPEAFDKAGRLRTSRKVA